MERDLIVSKTEIIEQLLKSKEEGTVIGITSPVLGRVMYLTAIDDMLMVENDFSHVVLKPFDTTGYMFPVRKISLENISSVRSFASKFINPFIPKENNTLI